MHHEHEHADSHDRGGWIVGDVKPAAIFTHMRGGLMSTDTQVAGEVVVAYKGFDANMKCRDFQFVVGETYTHDGDVRACVSGFHACTKPSDVWKYYGPAESRYAKVEMSGTLSRHDEDSKIAASIFKVVEEISAKDFVKLVVDEIFSAAKPGNSAQVASSGNSAKVASSGDYAQVDVKGKDSVVATCGVSNIIKGPIGTWVSVAEFVNGKCVGFATGRIGDDGIPADVWLKASGGKLVQA